MPSFDSKLVMREMILTRYFDVWLTLYPTIASTVATVRSKSKQKKTEMVDKILLLIHYIMVFSKILHLKCNNYIDGANILLQMNLI